MEFRLVFASLALVAFEAGQSRRSCFCLNSSVSLLPRAEFCIRVILFASRIWSHRLYFLCDLLYFIFNTIQCGVCHRVANKIVCESFLGNMNWFTCNYTWSILSLHPYKICCDSPCYFSSFSECCTVNVMAFFFKVAFLKTDNAVDALLLFDKCISNIFLEMPSMTEYRINLHLEKCVGKKVVF